MKIAILSDTFLPKVDGVANVVYKSASELSKLGHEVYVLTVTDGPHGKDFDSKNFKNDKFSLIRLPSVPFPVYAGSRFALPVGIAFRKIRKIKPDIIHTHTPFAIGWGSIWPAKLYKIPVVGTHHTFYNHYLKYVKLDFAWARKFTWRYTVNYYNHCDLVLIPSQSLADELKNHGLKKPIRTHPNPIDTDLFRPAENFLAKKKLKTSFNIKGKSLVYMGRVGYEKSIDQVIKAFALVVKKYPEVKLFIVGDGPERKKLEKLTEKLKIKNKVIFTGFLYNHDLVKALQSNDIFLTSSKTENMPLSILEAMATGLPVLGVDALGIPEIVKNNDNGFVVKPDDWEEMAKKIIKLLEDDKLLKKFSASSRKMSLNYSKENVAKSLEKIYQKLIKNK